MRVKLLIPNQISNNVRYSIYTQMVRLIETHTSFIGVSWDYVGIFSNVSYEGRDIFIDVNPLFNSFGEKYKADLDAGKGIHHLRGYYLMGEDSMVKTFKVTTVGFTTTDISVVYGRPDFDIRKHIPSHIMMEEIQQTDHIGDFLQRQAQADVCQRVEIINGWPGFERLDENYEGAGFKIGDILIAKTLRSDVKLFVKPDCEHAYVFMDNVVKYPHLFKMLQWWEKLDPSNQPETIISIHTGQVFQVSPDDYNNGYIMNEWTEWVKWPLSGFRPVDLDELANIQQSNG